MEFFKTFYRSSVKLLRSDNPRRDPPASVSLDKVCSAFLESPDLRDRISALVQGALQSFQEGVMVVKVNTLRKNFCYCCK